MSRRIAVYLGATTPRNPAYVAAVRELGREIARRGWTLVFGGSREGTMTVLADEVLSHGGRAVGVRAGEAAAGKARAAPEGAVLALAELELRAAAGTAEARSVAGGIRRSGGGFSLAGLGTPSLAPARPRWP